MTSHLLRQLYDQVDSLSRAQRRHLLSYRAFNQDDYLRSSRLSDLRAILVPVQLINLTFCQQGFLQARRHRNPWHNLSVGLHLDQVISLLRNRPLNLHAFRVHSQECAPVHSLFKFHPLNPLIFLADNPALNQLHSH